MTTYLTNEEMVELIKQAQAGSEEAENILIENSIKLITQQIRAYAGGGHDLEDLQQVAYIGFLKAIRTFNVEVETKFLSYAIPYAKGEVKRFIRDNGPVKTPRTIKELALKIKKKQLEKETVEHIMEELQVPKAKHVIDAIHFIMLKSGKPLSFSQPVQVDSSALERDVTLGDTISGDINASVTGEDWVDTYVTDEVLAKAMGVLSEQERQVINFRYFDLLNQTDTGKLMGVSQMHISRLERRALDKLAEYMGYSDRRKARTKKKEEVRDKKGDRLGVRNNPRGDREEAIRLLRETDMRCVDISKLTGVPSGTLFNFSKEYRSEEKRAAIKGRALAKVREKRWPDRKLVTAQ
jgi:RNA polymerase sporulation-specific sigma factor